MKCWLCGRTMDLFIHYKTKKKMWKCLHCFGWQCEPKLNEYIKGKSEEIAK